MESGMKEMESAIKELREKETRARSGGGTARLEAERKKGKLTARERIDYLLDAGSFEELNMLAETQCFDFEMQKKKVLTDGVVTGHGMIDGRRVFVFSQDASIFGGAAGRAHGQKIVHLFQLARKVGAPIIGLMDSAGGRIQEGMDNVAGYGEMFRQNVLSSGVIPQISAIMGVCTGGAVYSPALTDFILQVENTAQMFITGPGVIKAVTGESVSFEELGGVRVHTEKSGVATLAAKDDKDCLDKIRKLLSFLPSNNKECPPLLSPRDDPHRETPLLAQIVPADPSEFFDIHEVISEIVDEGDFFELFPDFALNIVIGFARMAGRTVAVIANQCLYYAGVLDINAADKASRFIRFSDAFGIPIVSLVDVPGYLPGVHQEHQGIIRHGAKMLYAYAEATVPKITCILRKAYGGSIPAMGGCHEIGVDYIMAWPCAEMAMMAAEPAVEIIYRKEIQNAPDPAEYKKAKVKEYRETFCTPYFAASKQLIDAVIEPKDTRKKIIRALLMLENKTEETPCRKHGIFPV